MVILVLLSGKYKKISGWFFYRPDIIMIIVKTQNPAPQLIIY